MHIIENYSSGTIELVTNCERAWPMPELQQSGSHWLRRQFPGQYCLGTTHGGRGGDVVLSFRVIECDESIYRAAAEATDGHDGFATSCGRYGVLPGSDFARQARNWQARCRRETKMNSKLAAASLEKAKAEKSARIVAGRMRAQEFSGDVAEWLAAPFYPAPPVVVAAKQASGLSWSEFTSKNF